MRQSAVEHALQTFRRYGLDLDTVKCIDVGGTRHVYLETEHVRQLTPHEKLKNDILHVLGEKTRVSKEVIVTQNPLIEKIRDLRFLDRGFNADAIETLSDIEADFLVEADVAPLTNTFDLVLSFDTLEHVSDPFTFCNNLLRVAKPEGYIYLQTVFKWDYHPSPKDYFRFSPDGLRECFSRSGGEMLECDWHEEEISVFAFLKKPF